MNSFAPSLQYVKAVHSVFNASIHVGLVGRRCSVRAVVDSLVVQDDDDRSASVLTHHGRAMAGLFVCLCLTFALAPTSPAAAAIRRIRTITER